jgi:hypothetical protein
MDLPNTVEKVAGALQDKAKEERDSPSLWAAASGRRFE